MNFWPRLMLLLLLAVGARASQAGMTMLADFEPEGLNPFAGGVVEKQPALAGEGSLRVDEGAITLDRALDWSPYDFLHADVFNPGPVPVTLALEVRDAETKGYWTRVNLTTIVAPGRSEVRIPVGMYVGEKSRPGRALLKDRITRFALTVGEGGPVYFDDFRLETLNTSVAQFAGLRAFDFGPAGAPVLEGFTPVATQAWSEATGYGWVTARIWRAVNALQPEPLTQDFVCPEAGAFRLRVSNGTYRVGFNITSPKGYWGESQTYRARRVSVNGAVAVQDEQTFSTYLSRYFQHADREDLPGVSAFDRYVLTPMTETWVTTEITNELVEVEFRGQAWANCLTHLIVYPAEQAEAGTRFLAWAQDRRRAHFENYFKMLPMVRVGAAPPAEGYQVFQRHFMDRIGPTDGPAEGEDFGPEASLHVRAAQGEEVALTLGVQPAAQESVPHAEVRGLLHNAEGLPLDAASLQLGWIDYRLGRVAMDGSIYDVRPRYWRAGVPPAIPGITRCYWLRWQPTAGTTPGVYTGQLALVSEAGAVREIPLALEVLPITLAAVDQLAVGPWGSGIPMGWFADDPETRAWDEDMFTKALDALKRHGFTSLSARPNIQIVYGDGSFTVDFHQADREMALLRSKGFRHLISSYGLQRVGYNLYQGPTGDEVRRAGFTNALDFLAEYYRRVEAHAVEHNWLPVAWNLCDEPIGGDIAPAVSNALLHRAAAGGLTMNTFMGATSMRGDDPADPHFALVQALPMPTLTIHDAEAIAVAHAASNQFAYYNGGDRWTYGRYMKMLEARHQLKLRLNWHYNVVAGDPYNALDCREDDYCWYNSNARGELIPSLSLLQDMVPGLNDYRYLLTLEQACAAHEEEAAAVAGRKLLQEVHALRAGPDARTGSERAREHQYQSYERERDRVIAAILALSPATSAEQP